MGFLHKQAFTQDLSPYDRIWRELTEAKFMIRADPSERDRYPSGYWRACYYHWNAIDPQGHYKSSTAQRLRFNKWRDRAYHARYIYKRHGEELLRFFAVIVFTLSAFYYLFIR